MGHVRDVAPIVCHAVPNEAWTRVLRCASLSGSCVMQQKYVPNRLHCVGSNRVWARPSKETPRTRIHHPRQSLATTSFTHITTAIHHRLPPTTYHTHHQAPTLSLPPFLAHSGRQTSASRPASLDNPPLFNCPSDHPERTETNHPSHPSRDPPGGRNPSAGHIHPPSHPHCRRPCISDIRGLCLLQEAESDV